MTVDMIAIFKMTVVMYYENKCNMFEYVAQRLNFTAGILIMLACLTII